MEPSSNLAPAGDRLPTGQISGKRAAAVGTSSPAPAPRQGSTNRTDTGRSALVEGFTVRPLNRPSRCVEGTGSVEWNPGRRS